MRLVEARPEHIPFLADHMRPADVAECAAFGRNPHSAITHGLRSSLWALSAIVEGQPHAMLGVASLSMLESAGVPWMLGTERVYDHGRDMIRQAPAILAEMHETFATLENLVSADNDRAIRFLRHVGFEIYDDVTIVRGTSFVRFRKA